MVTLTRPTTPSHVIVDPTAATPMAVNSDGSINVNGTISATNPSVAPTGAAVPADATAIGFQDGSSNLQLVSAGNPLPITGSISATNPSVSATGAAVPASATAIGWSDGTGKLQIPSSGNPLPVSGTVTVNAGTNLNTSALNLEATQSAFKSANHTDLAAINTTLNSPFQAGGSIGNTGFNVTGSLPSGSNTIGKVDILGNAGATLDGTVAAGTAPTNGVAVLAQYHSTEIGPTDTQTFALQGDSKGRLREVIMDAAGNSRGVNVTAGNALLTDGSATTQPISAASLPLPAGASTAAKQPALGTAGTASADVITIQGIASMTKLLVTPDSVALPANQSVNVAQVNGVTTSTGTGAVGTGSQRVAVGTDTATIAGSAPGTAGSASAQVVTVQGVASMTKLLVTPDSVALPANQSVNVNQLAGTTTDTNSGNKSAGTLRVVIATDQPQLTNKLLVTPDANSAVNVAQWGGTTSVTGGVNGSVGVGGLAASGASTSGNPLLDGGRAATTNPSAVTDGQAVAKMLDKVGKTITVMGAPRALVSTQKTSLSNTTSETTIVTAVASTFLDLAGLIFANTGATTTKVDIRDTTGGSIIMTFEVPTLETRGGMFTVLIPQTTVNTNWTAQCAAATTAMEVTAIYVKNI